MKEKILKPIIFASLLLLFAASGFSQQSRVKVYSTDGDGDNCGPNLSAYRTFSKLELYDDAKPTWLKVFNQCPAFSETVYLDGVTMYRSFIEAAPEGPVREGLIDTLMLIYDRRIENFGGEGNVLGRKGRDLLNYRRDDILEVKNAYDMLQTSIELSGQETQDAVMLLCISSGITLAENGLIDTNQVLADYITVNTILVQHEKRGTRWERTREAIDDMMLDEEILSCEALNRYYEPQFPQNKNDLAFLQTVIFSYNASGCDQSAYYAAATEELYLLNPNPESAHEVAIQYITLNDLKTAAIYLKKAVEGENIDTDTRALWYYELAVVSNANKDYCEAIDYAREAIRLKNEYGKAYFLLGDVFIAYRDSLGDDFQQRTAFWAAADKYKKAATVDPSLAEVSDERLRELAGLFPDKEENFFLELKEGDPFQVGGCINESTTVRSRI